ncbi:MAG TPA: pyridoxal-phosphate dependent enzyme [Thermoleophilaceae bacterium]|nr:pyridoxal-phosphate dependent enzyme [Thermoleophilaceae bacterium]
MRLRAVVNSAVDPGAVPVPSSDAAAFHAGLPGYRPTPVHELTALAAELGLRRVGLKDESDRLGLPAFKVLGASWAVERALRERPEVRTLVAASAGNHGRAVAHVAAQRGLFCRVYLPARSLDARRRAIAGEGADVMVVEGSYEEAVAAAADAAGRPDTAEIADVGDSAPARWVIDGYQTLFDEIPSQGSFDLLVVPVGVGSLAAAAARFAARAGLAVVGVEPESAACLGASLAAGRPTAVDTPGTSMAGLDCAEVSAAAWPSLQRGIHGTLVVSDAEAESAVQELAHAGLAIGHSGAATLAGLRALATETACAPLRETVGLGPSSRVLAIATEGRTDLVS